MLHRGSSCLFWFYCCYCFFLVNLFNGSIHDISFCEVNLVVLFINDLPVRFFHILFLAFSLKLKFLSLLLTRLPSTSFPLFFINFISVKNCSVCRNCFANSSKLFCKQLKQNVKTLKIWKAQQFFVSLGISKKLRFLYFDVKCSTAALCSTLFIFGINAFISRFLYPVHLHERLSIPCMKKPCSLYFYFLKFIQVKTPQQSVLPKTARQEAVLIQSS